MITIEEKKARARLASRKYYQRSRSGKNIRRTCLFCGKDLPRDGKRIKYCSDICSKRRDRGVDVPLWYDNAEVLSWLEERTLDNRDWMRKKGYHVPDRPYDKSNPKNHVKPLRSCVVCGDKFRSPYSNHKYCTQTCRNKHHNEKSQSTEVDKSVSSREGDFE